MKKTFSLWRYLCAVLLTVTFGVSQMWGESVTVGLTTALSTTSGQGGSEVYSNASNTHLTVTRAAGTIGTGQDTVIANTSGTQAVKMASNTNQYAAYLYNIKKSMNGFSSVRYAGYSVSVADGYKYSLTALNASLAGTANFTWKVEIINSTGTVLYTTGNKTITNYNSTSATNYSIASNLSSTSTVQDLTGTFYVRAYFYIGSTSKYLCFPTLTITGDLESETPAATYTVTIDPNGGSYASTPDGWTLTDGKYTKSGLSGSFNVPAGLTKDNMDLNGWKDGQGNNITLPFTLSHDTTLVAQWAAHTESSDATLSALSVAGCTLSPAFAPATTSYTISLPFYASMPAVGDVTATKNDSYAKTPVVSISGNVITVACEAEDGTKMSYNITVNIAPAPTASTSINIEQLVLDYGKSYKIADALTSANIVTDGRNGLDSIDESKDYRNYAFWGLKLKKNDADILKVIVPAGKVLNIKIGSIGAAVNVLINNEAYTTIAADKNKINHFFHLDATENPREVIFHTTANETTTLQQVKIGEECDDFTLPALYTVTYNAGAGTCEKATDFVEFADDKITLPEVTPAIGYSFNGWFNSATEGTKVGDAGAKITLSKDSTLYAQYSIIDYAITCSPAENGSVSAKATANYGEVVTLTVSPNDDYVATNVSYNGTTITPVENVYSFIMPAEAVTVTATFAKSSTGVDNTEVGAKAVKTLKNGVLIIEKNGVRYNMLGERVQ